MHYTLLHTDGVVILVYFAIVLAIGLSSSQRQGGDCAKYFLAGRSLGWLSIGTSLVAADVLCGRLIGFSGSYGGALVIDLEIAGVVGLVILGWWLGPKLANDKTFTITEFLTRTYNESARTFVSGSYILIYLLIRLSLLLFLGSFVIQMFSSSDIDVTMVAIILIAGLYSIVGGYSAVVSTQVFQAVVMLIGFAVLFFSPSGSATLQNVRSTDGYFMTGAQSVQSAGIPWLALIFGVPIVALWLWLSDQYMVQHILAARSQKDIRMGAILAAIIKVLIIIPMLIWVLVSYDGSKSVTATNQVPMLFRGIALVAVFSAMMASLSGLFNSTSALFTLDFYRRRNPFASEQKLVLVGRLSTTAAVLISVLWMPLITIIDWQSVNSLQSLLIYFAATVMAVFLSRLIWKRATGLATGSTLLVAGILSCLKILSRRLVNPQFIHNKILEWLLQTSYLDFAVLIFFVSVVVIVCVSLVAPSPDPQVASPQVERNS